MERESFVTRKDQKKKEKKPTETQKNKKVQENFKSVQKERKRTQDGGLMNISDCKARPAFPARYW